MTYKYKEHVDQIDTWFRGALTTKLSSQQLVELFEQTTTSLWRRSKVTVSAVLLGAIWDRIVFNGIEGHPMLSLLKIDETGVKFDELHKSVQSLDERELADTIQFVVTQFIVILANLTNDVITPSLFSDLLAIQPGPANKTDRSSNGDEK